MFRVAASAPRSHDPEVNPPEGPDLRAVRIVGQWQTKVVRGWVGGWKGGVTRLVGGLGWGKATLCGDEGPGLRPHLVHRS